MDGHGSDGPAPPPEEGERQPGLNQAALLAKLKLLPQRERELTALRQIHQQQLRWIEGAQQLMVRLSRASTIADAVDAVVRSLLDEFGFDISGCSGPQPLMVGDPVVGLTAADRELIEQVVRQAQESGELIVAEGEGQEGERNLGWLMAGLAATSDMGKEPVVFVGRTCRTARYYPVPKQPESRLYKHLLATVAQVFRSTALQERHNSRLEQEVAERTAALQEAQKRVFELEKQKVTEQMAGGFAHEMRNALSGSKIMIENAMGGGAPGSKSLVDRTAAELKELFLTARQRLDPAELERFRSGVQEIARNERVLDEVLHNVDGALRRALEITTLIMEYSRLGCSQRGFELVDFAATARGIVAESSAAFREHAVQAAVHVEGSCLLRGNDAHVYSMLKNLVANALDALRELEDERARCLTIELQGSAERVVCRVIDNAQGIPEEHRQRIFEPFFSTKPQTGTGLGLSMVLKLVALHDGTLELETQLGQGSRFVLSFPTSTEHELGKERS